MFDPIHRFRRPQWLVLLLAAYLFGPGFPCRSAALASGFPYGRVSAVMPFAGITAADMAALVTATGTYEFLAAGRRALLSRMRFAHRMRGGGVRSSRVDQGRRLVAALCRGVQAA